MPPYLWPWQALLSAPWLSLARWLCESYRLHDDLFPSCLWPGGGGKAVGCTAIKLSSLYHLGSLYIIWYVFAYLPVGFWAHSAEAASWMMCH